MNSHEERSEVDVMAALAKLALSTRDELQEQLKQMDRDAEKLRRAFINILILWIPTIGIAIWLWLELRS